MCVTNCARAHICVCVSVHTCVRVRVHATMSVCESEAESNGSKIPTFTTQFTETVN